MPMANPITIILIVSLMFALFSRSLAINRVTYNALDLGAKGDGKTDSTTAFSKAWSAACGSPGPATIYAPPGRYLLKNAHFKGLCKNKAITIKIDGTLVAPSDYDVIGNVGNWLLFEGADGVSIEGGILDGQGTGLWACKSTSKSCPGGATVYPLSGFSTDIDRADFN